jgi:ADP-ribose pyrophosphatase
MSDSDDGIEVIAQGRFVRLARRGTWEFAERFGIGGIVAIVALTPDERVVLVEQYRIPVGARVVELPAGLAGDTPELAGEALEVAARRELLEETGWAAGALERLAEGPPSAGLTTERISFFRARDLQREGEGGGDVSEDIEVHEVDLDAVDEWLGERQRKGRLVDPKVYAGLYLLERQRRA